MQAPFSLAPSAYAREYEIKAIIADILRANAWRLEARNRIFHACDVSVALTIFDRWTAYRRPMNDLLTRLESE